MSEKPIKFSKSVGNIKRGTLLKPVAPDALLEIMKEKRRTLQEQAHLDNLAEFEQELNCD